MGGGDNLCDNSRAKNSSELSFHGAYEHHWGETKQYRICISRHCAVCGDALQTGVVGDCEVCCLNMHLTCARKLNFYCFVCLTMPSGS